MTPRRPTRSTRHTLRAALLALALAGIGLLAGPATPAAAHAGLVGASPAQNSVVLGQAPTQVVLTFTEGVTPVNGKVRVIAPDGTRADTGEPEVSRHPADHSAAAGRAERHLPGQLPGHLGGQPSGRRRVHLLGGDPRPRCRWTTTSRSPATRSWSTALPIVRWIGYVGLLLLVGAVLVLALLWPQRLDRRRPDPGDLARRRPGGAGHRARALPADPVRHRRWPLRRSAAPTCSEVLSSQYGAAHLIRLGVLGAALVLVAARSCSGKGWGADRVLLAVLGAIGVGHVVGLRAPQRVRGAAGHGRRRHGPPRLDERLAGRSGHAHRLPAAPGQRDRARRDRAGLVALGDLRGRRAACSPGWPRRSSWSAPSTRSSPARTAGCCWPRRRWCWSSSRWRACPAGWSAPIAARATGAVPRLRDARHRRGEPSPWSCWGSPRCWCRPPRRVRPARPRSAIQSAIMRTSCSPSASTSIRHGRAPTRSTCTRPPRTASRPSIVEWTVKASNPSQGIEPIDAAVLVFSADHAVGQIGIPTGGTWRVHRSPCVPPTSTRRPSPRTS